MVEGKDIFLSEQAPRLIIPKNSIGFVSMRQVLCLPHYLVGRFDLTIDFIYRGLLLGTGPQVDPGFQGGLGCPLHNISNEDIEMRLGEPFAKIDFVKTGPRAATTTAQWTHIRSERELAAWLGENANANVRLFKGGKPQWREPIFGYTGGRRPTSSVQQLTKEVSRFQKIGYLGIATVAIAVVTLVLAALQLNGGVSDTKQELQRVKDCQLALYQRYEAIITGIATPKKLHQLPKPSACPSA
jgi:hypothetical protein